MDLTVQYGCEAMDFEKVTDMLSKAYWSIDIGIEEVIKGARNSTLVAGAFANGIQVGYSRVVSDKIRFAYICDVIVDKNYRKNGVGQRMIQGIQHHEELKDVYRWLLVTEDAQKFYAKSGFKPLSHPKSWMSIELPERKR